MSKLDPDTFLFISLIGTAERLHNARWTREAAVDELRTLARGRTDLLSKAAGWFDARDAWNSETCASVLVEAGGTDEEARAVEAERVRRNMETSGYTTEGTAGPQRNLSW